MRYAQIVLGPAGSGKTTYCKVFQDYLLSCKRKCHIINLDPATEEGVIFENPGKQRPNQPSESPFDTDIRDFVDIGEVIESENLGPNGALVRSCELLASNLEWLSEQLESTYGDESYLLFDTPGQIELFLHIPYVKSISNLLNRLSINCLAIYLLDVSFVNDPAKLISGSLAGLAAMVNLEMPHLNILSKCDLLTQLHKPQNFDNVTSSTFGFTSKNLNFQKLFISQQNDTADKMDKMDEMDQLLNLDDLVNKLDKHLPSTFKSLNVAFTSLLQDFDLVSFVPLNINDEESLHRLLVATDIALQFGEEAEPNTKDF